MKRNSLSFSPRFARSPLTKIAALGGVILGITGPAVGGDSPRGALLLPPQPASRHEVTTVARGAVDAAGVDPLATTPVPKKSPPSKVSASPAWLNPDAGVQPAGARLASPLGSLGSRAGAGRTPPTSPGPASQPSFLESTWGKVRSWFTDDSPGVLPPSLPKPLTGPEVASNPPSARPPRRPASLSQPPQPRGNTPGWGLTQFNDANRFASTAMSPLQGVSPSGAPVLAGPPAYRWYGWGTVTPGANPYAPTGQYPKASADWYTLTKATPGAFPVPIPASDAGLGPEPPTYRVLPASRLWTTPMNLSVKPQTFPAETFSQGVESALPTITPIPPQRSSIRENLSSDLPIPSLPQPIRFGASEHSIFEKPVSHSIENLTHNPMVKEENILTRSDLSPLPDPQPLVEPSGLASSRRVDKAIENPDSDIPTSLLLPRIPELPSSNRTELGRPAPLPPLMPTPIVENDKKTSTESSDAQRPSVLPDGSPQSSASSAEELQWQSQPVQGEPLDHWMPSEVQPRSVPPHPSNTNRPAGDVPWSRSSGINRVVARGQAPDDSNDPTITLINQLLRGKAEEIDIRWTGDRQLTICFQCASREEGQRIVRELSARPELIPLQVDFCVFIMR